jgi:hypothetical protein
MALVRERTVPTSDRRLAAKLVPNFADRGCHVVSVTDPYGRILGFLDRSRYFFVQVAPQLYSRGLVDHVPDPLFLRKFGGAGNRTRDFWICSPDLWPLDHRGGLKIFEIISLLLGFSSYLLLFEQYNNNIIIGKTLHSDANIK